jgi:hypothetical protein
VGRDRRPRGADAHGARRDVPLLPRGAAHALDFDAWRSLARGGLDDDEIAELMVALVRAASEPRGKLPS